MCSGSTGRGSCPGRVLGLYTSNNFKFIIRVWINLQKSLKSKTIHTHLNPKKKFSKWWVDREVVTYVRFSRVTSLVHCNTVTQAPRLRIPSQKEMGLHRREGAAPRPEQPHLSAAPPATPTFCVFVVGSCCVFCAFL